MRETGRAKTAQVCVVYSSHLLASHPLVVLKLPVAARMEQSDRARRHAHIAREVERGRAVRADRVDVRAVLDQQLNDRGLFIAAHNRHLHST